MKAINSNFKHRDVDKVLEETKNWTSRWPPVKPKVIENPITWATANPTFLCLTEKERKLNNKAMISFKKPKALKNLLLRHKRTALTKNIDEIFKENEDENNSRSSGCSQPCKKCSICGNWGSYLNRPCVYLRKALKAEDGKLIKLTENLNCQNFGIYVLTCRLCLETLELLKITLAKLNVLFEQE